MIFRLLVLITAILALVAHPDARAADLLALEMERYDAMVEADIDRLDDMLAAELVFTHASSNLDTKASFLKKLGDGRMVYKEIDVNDVKVQQYESCGVLTGQSVLTISVNGEDRTLDLRFTTVWVLEEDNWKVAAYQSTFNQ